MNPRSFSGNEQIAHSRRMSGGRIFAGRPKKNFFFCVKTRNGAHPNLLGLNGYESRLTVLMQGVINIEAVCWRTAFRFGLGGGEKDGDVVWTWWGRW